MLTPFVWEERALRKLKECAKDTSFVNHQRKVQELVPIFPRLQRPNFDPGAGMEGYAFACMQLPTAL